MKLLNIFRFQSQNDKKNCCESHKNDWRSNGIGDEEHIENETAQYMLV